MTRKNVLRALLVLLLLATGFGFAVMTGPQDPWPEDAAPALPLAKATYERVVGTGRLQCGVYNLPPYFTDANTGLLPELMAKVSAHLGVGFMLRAEPAADVITLINDGMIDAYCFGAPQSPAALQALDMGAPLFYVPLYFYVESGKPAPTDFNQTGITIAVHEGGLGARLIARRYAQAKAVSFGAPQDAYAAVLAGKADALIADPASTAMFNANSGDSALKQVGTTPLYLQPIYVMTTKGDQGLRNMIDEAVSTLAAQGALQQLIKKYDSTGKAILIPASPLGASVVTLSAE